MHDPHSDNWSGSATHLAAVSARLPRLLRVALAKTTAFDAAVDVIVTEVAAVDPRLEGRIRAAVDDHRFPELRLQRASVPPVAPVTVASIVRKLDGKAVRGVPAARELGNLLLLILGDPSDTKTCARLAVACRDALRPVTARSLAQSVAASAGMPPVDWHTVSKVVSGFMADSFVEKDEEEIDLSPARGAGFLTSEDPSVARALQLDAWRTAGQMIMDSARNLIMGLSCMAAGQTSPRYAGSLAEHAQGLGETVLYAVRQAAEQGVVARYEQLLTGERRRRAAAEAAAKPVEPVAPIASATIPPGHVLVAPKIEGGPKVKEIIRGHEQILGKPVPLVETPDLVAVERALLREFPHCAAIVHAILREMSGKPHVALRPILLRGDPGTGKSRFARRLGELLGVGVFRVDGSGDGGVSFAGTERRWYSTEPCRPFMACSRFGHANPMVLVDELDKAPRRADYGRLWDGMLGFLEKETAGRFQDPCLQAELDLGHVLYVATVNEVTHLPGPLLDRFGVVLEFPTPDRSHLGPLAWHLAIEQAAALGVDPRFVEPFEEAELVVMSRHWKGGSIRRLGRIVATVLRARERRDRSLLN